MSYKGYIMSDEQKKKISDTKKKQSIVPKTAFKKGYTSWNKGKPAPWVTKRNLSNNPVKKGKEHHNWQGEFTSYRSMHRWVVNTKGQPETCESCLKTGLSGRQIHWANKDHAYRREADDYIRLCVKCHKKYDSLNN